MIVIDNGRSAINNNFNVKLTNVNFYYFLFYNNYNINYIYILIFLSFLYLSYYRDYNGILQYLVHKVNLVIVCCENLHDYHI